jgi:hypothetical protein
MTRTFSTRKKKRTTEQHDYISLNEIISYDWKTENIKFKDNPANTTIPYDSTSNWETGILAVQQMAKSFFRVLKKA